MSDGDHDKILCERLATTVDHGICKCFERHRITKLEQELFSARTKHKEDAGQIVALMYERDNYRRRVEQAESVRDVFAAGLIASCTKAAGGEG
jgi:hypothetical protein